MSEGAYLPAHADNCNLNVTSGQCQYSSQAFTWRHYTLVTPCHSHHCHLSLPSITAVSLVTLITVMSLVTHITEICIYPLSLLSLRCHLSLPH